MLGTAVGRIILGGKRIGRVSFLAGMSEILGANQRILYVPNGTDTTTSVESSTVGRTFTWDATVAARVSPLGNLFQQSFNGVDQWGDAPDAADLSFGNGTVDSAFSVLVLARVTDTAAFRTLLAKYQDNNREWMVYIDGTDHLSMLLYDQSAGAVPFRVSDATIMQGSFALFGATYSAATGGATAANDIAFYQNGVSMPSTATNSGTYVAMENLAASVEIATNTIHVVQPFPGAIAMIALTQRALTAADHAQARVLCRQATGLAL